MLFSCVLNSLSSEGALKVYNRNTDFHVNGQESGILLTKVVLLESGLQTNATIMKLKAEVQELPLLMTKMGNNIEKFNQCVLSKVIGLRRMGSDCPDLLHQLFPAYLACPDKAFNRYVESKQSEFEDGKPITFKALMQDCLYKYKTMHDRGTWQAPDSQEEKILALQATITNLSRQFKGADNKKIPKNPGNKKTAAAPKPNDNLPYQWYLIPPAAGEPSSKVVRGRTVHFCSAKYGAPKDKGCNKWVRHAPATCQGLSKQKAQPGAQKRTFEKPVDPRPNNNKKRALQVKAATMEIEHIHVDTSSCPSSPESKECEWMASDDEMNLKSDN